MAYKFCTIGYHRALLAKYVETVFWEDRAFLFILIVRKKFVKSLPKKCVWHSSLSIV